MKQPETEELTMQTTDSPKPTVTEVSACEGLTTAPCSACGGCGMLPGTAPDDDVMNTPCPQCNPWAKAKTLTHEPAIAVHNVFSEAIPGAFGVGFLARLLHKPNDQVRRPAANGIADTTN